MPPLEHLKATPSERSPVGPAARPARACALRMTTRRDSHLREGSPVRVRKRASRKAPQIAGFVVLGDNGNWCGPHQVRTRLADGVLGGDPLGSFELVEDVPVGG